MEQWLTAQRIAPEGSRSTATILGDHHLRGMQNQFRCAGDRVLLVKEAKARVSGSDSLEKLLLTNRLSMAEDPGVDLNNNIGRRLGWLR